MESNIVVVYWNHSDSAVSVSKWLQVFGKQLILKCAACVWPQKHKKNALEGYTQTFPADLDTGTHKLVNVRGSQEMRSESRLKPCEPDPSRDYQDEGWALEWSSCTLRPVIVCLLEVTTQLAGLNFLTVPGLLSDGRNIYSLVCLKVLNLSGLAKVRFKWYTFST